ncbi:hypothetical protein DMH08_02850 [Actinomadura sp. WAC 06369]|nr:hypothetical protein DMH08_02850 [Actinomadura sp. WAC 06369]
MRWTFEGITGPAGCPTVSWCGGGCDTAPAGASNVLHGRMIANAFHGDVLVLSVDVWQVKAVTPWRESGDLFYPNDDEAPRVRVFQYSPNEGDAGDLSLAVPDAVTLVGMLRATGADQLADAIQNAVNLAAAIAVGVRS